MSPRFFTIALTLIVSSPLYAAPKPLAFTCWEDLGEAPYVYSNVRIALYPIPATPAEFGGDSEGEYEAVATIMSDLNSIVKKSTSLVPELRTKNNEQGEPKTYVTLVPMTEEKVGDDVEISGRVLAGLLMSDLNTAYWIRTTDIAGNTLQIAVTHEHGADEVSVQLVVNAEKVFPARTCKTLLLPDSE